MLRNLFFVFMYLFALPGSMVAQAVAEFPKKVHDFGAVSEKTDSVTCVFDVVNAGDLPMAIEGVYVSCGCTSATHSKDVIPPGDKGYVYVSFYPKDLGGRYLKTIYVYTTTRPRKNYVRIKATVVP